MSEPSVLTPAVSVLAQSTSGGGSGRAIIAAVALIALVILLGWVIVMVRNRAMTPSTPSEPTEGLLGQLRELKKTGELSDEEYARYRANLAAKLAGRDLPHPEMPPIPSPDGILTARSGFDLTGAPLPADAPPPEPPPSGTRGGEPSEPGGRGR